MLKVYRTSLYMRSKSFEFRSIWAEMCVEFEEKINK